MENGVKICSFYEALDFQVVESSRGGLFRFWEESQKPLWLKYAPWIKGHLRLSWDQSEKVWEQGSSQNLLWGVALLLLRSHPRVRGEPGLASDGPLHFGHYWDSTGDKLWHFQYRISLLNFGSISRYQILEFMKSDLISIFLLLPILNKIKIEPLIYCLWHHHYILYEITK